MVVPKAVADQKVEAVFGVSGDPHGGDLINGIFFISEDVTADLAGLVTADPVRDCLKPAVKGFGILQGRARLIQFDVYVVYGFFLETLDLIRILYPPKL